MANDLSTLAEFDAEADRLGKLPHAPRPMPAQVLEHPQGLFARLWPVCNGWLRANGFGN